MIKPSLNKKPVIDKIGAPYIINELDKVLTTSVFDYLSFFYSRFLPSRGSSTETLWAKLYTLESMKTVKLFGAYWVKKGHLVGSFLEGGTKEEYETISKATQLKPAVTDLEELGREGLGFAQTVVSEHIVPKVKDVPSSGMVRKTSRVVMMEKPLHVWHRRLESLWLRLRFGTGGDAVVGEKLFAGILNHTGGYEFIGNRICCCLCSIGGNIYRRGEKSKLLTVITLVYDYYMLLLY